MLCCDSAIMPGEGGGGGGGVEARGEGDSGYFSIETVSMLGSCFA